MLYQLSYLGMAMHIGTARPRRSLTFAPDPVQTSTDKREGSGGSQAQPNY